MSQTLATVHAGTLQRWYEALCRIQHRTLRPLVAGSLRGLRPGAVPALGGVYCFWWTGPLERLRSEECNRRIELKGAGGRPVTVHLDDEWLGLDAGLPIPLYVGNTHGSVARRLGQHLRLKDVHTGLEDTRPLVLDNVGLSEDYAVGLMLGRG